MSAREGLTLWAAAWQAASEGDRALWQAAENGDPAVSMIGVQGAMLDALHGRLRQGEWQAVGFVHVDAVEPQAVPVPWWGDMRLFLPDHARGAEHEVWSLRVLVPAAATKPKGFRHGEDEHVELYRQHMRDLGKDLDDDYEVPPALADVESALAGLIGRAALRRAHQEVWGSRARKKGRRAATKP